MDFDAIRDVWTAETGGEMTVADEAMIRKIVDQDRVMGAARWQMSIIRFAS